MKITDLAPQYEPLYYVCLEDWSDELKEAGNHKQLWCGKMKEQGLRVKLALDDDGQVGGMIQYLPIEHSVAEGSDLYLIACIWVHGHKQGRGNFQKRGMGKALLQAAEEDVRDLGAKGLVAWGLWLPFWMKASWYKKRGYKKVDRDGIKVLLWKPLVEDALPPKWIRQKKKPARLPGKVAVTAFVNGWCPAQNMVFERAKRAASCFGAEVVFREINTFDRQVFLEWGIADDLFIDGKRVSTGPPLSYDKIKKLIARRVRKL